MKKIYYKDILLTLHPDTFSLFLTFYPCFIVVIVFMSNHIDNSETRNITNLRIVCPDLVMNIMLGI